MTQNIPVTHDPLRYLTRRLLGQVGQASRDHALIEPGDHVVVETPCYESALQVARSTGATVSEWRRSAGDVWAHDLDALESALRADTKLVYINSPHNPTGMLMSREVLDGVVELCADRGAWLFSDEVYREL